MYTHTLTEFSLVFLIEKKLILCGVITEEGIKHKYKSLLPPVTLIICSIVLDIFHKIQNELHRPQKYNRMKKLLTNALKSV